MSQEVDQFLQNSMELNEYLNHFPTPEARSQYITLLNQKLDQRVEIAKRLKSQNFNPFVDGENHEYLLKIDQNISTLLEKLKDSIKLDILQIKKVKQDEIKYIDPYNQISHHNGIYYDRKK